MKLIRITLGSILTFIAINAFGGGYYGMAGAENIPLEWLKGSPFSSYFFPGLFLFVVIGGLCLYSSIAVFKQWRSGSITSFISGIIILSWIIVQVSIIGYVSWMQPAIFIAGLIVLALTWFIKNKQVK